ncbi:MAG: site-2 protease family protein [Eubacteriales bacterium]|nr:site-2 protease family protein [Eubacteriales bacterium]
MLLRILMSGDLRMALIVLALSLPAIVLCLSVHEAAHGAAAYLQGDRTAHDSGRITLSPLAHIDPIGFLCLLLFGFGWARPVPVDISRFRDRRRGMALTALAGPVANFVTALLAFTAYLLLGDWLIGPQVFAMGTNGIYLLLGLLTTGQLAVHGAAAFLLVLLLFLGYTATLSVGLGVFNLIPVHPLDGSRVVDALLPFSWTSKLQQYRGAILLVFIAALYFGWLDGLIVAADRLLLGAAARIALLFV